MQHISPKKQKALKVIRMLQCQTNCFNLRVRTFDLMKNTCQSPERQSNYCDKTWSNVIKHISILTLKPVTQKYTETVLRSLTGLMTPCYPHATLRHATCKAKPGPNFQPWSAPRGIYQGNLNEHVWHCLTQMNHLVSALCVWPAQHWHPRNPQGRPTPWPTSRWWDCWCLGTAPW